MTIYKIFRRPEWAELAEAGVTNGAPVDLADGYIHFSTAETLRATAEKWFAADSDLILCAIDETRLGEALRWEPARGGTLFPHLYRPLALAEVIWHGPMGGGPEGFLFPDDIP